MRYLTRLLDICTVACWGCISFLSSSGAYLWSGDWRVFYQPWSLNRILAWGNMTTNSFPPTWEFTLTTTLCCIFRMLNYWLKILESWNLVFSVLFPEYWIEFIQVSLLSNGMQMCVGRQSEQYRRDNFIIVGGCMVLQWWYGFHHSGVVDPTRNQL